MLNAIRTHGERDFTDFDATQLLKKIKMEIRAPEFAIGNRFKSYALLELHDLGDGFVFNGTQLRRRDFS
jgi:hypothetical protein